MWQTTRPVWQAAAAIAAILCVGGILNYLAGPAALLDPSTLEHRYGSGVSNDTRALTLFAELPYIFYLWLLAGCVSMWAAIRFKGEPWALPVLVSLACLAGAGAKTLGWEQQHWLWGGACAVAIALVMFIFLNQKRQYRPAEQVLWGRLFSIWFLWFFLLAIGVLWLHDLASRGPNTPKFKYMGVHQLDSVWLAVMLVAPLVAWGGHKAIAFLFFLSSWWNQQRGSWALLTLSVITPVSMFGLVWIGKDLGKPHISAEAVRLILTVAIAWLMARYYEWGASFRATHPYRKILLLIVAASLATLALTRDFGPVLALSFAMIPVLLSKTTSARAITTRQILAFCAAWFVFFSLIRVSFVHWLPQSLAPDHLMSRLESMQSPFSSAMAYGAQINWLLEASGPFGFGLGSVPWCGARALAGIGACTRATGVTTQYGSDYVFTALSATWGQNFSMGLVGLSLLLLLAVGWFTARRAPEEQSESVSTKIRSWLVLIYTGMLLGQLFVSVAGNQMWLPLSGITQPFVGLGTVAMQAAAAVIGLTLGDLRSKKSQAEEVAWISAATARYCSGVAAGGIAFAAAMLIRISSPLEVSDKLTPALIVQGISHLRKIESGGLHNSTVKEIEGCRVRKDSLIRALQLVDGKTPNEELTCHEARAIVAAATWLKAQSRQPEMLLTYASVSDVGTSNPYRIPGCISMSGNAASEMQGAPPSLPCPALTEAGTALLKSSPQLRQGLASLTQSVRRPPHQGLSPTTLSIPPKTITNIELLAVPEWSAPLGPLQKTVRTIFLANPPRPTVIGQGAHVQLSIDTRTQHRAQELVDCYTGPCKAMSGAETQGNAMLEQARSRMAAVLVVDIASGQIEAAASAHTKCYAAHHSGVTLQDCISIPQPSRKRPWKLSNQALHGEAMPGSLAKLPVALALLRERSPLTRNNAAFLSAIRKSMTEELIDNALCFDTQFNSHCAQRRLSAIQQATQDLGGCSGTAECQSLDLFGKTPQTFMVQSTRMLNDSAPQLDPRSVQDCYKNADEHRWRDCKGIPLVATVAEIFGQGSSSATPPGIALSLVRLSSAANTTASASAIAPSLSVLAPQPASEGQSNRSLNPIAPEHAQRLLTAMLEPIKPGGTAHLACLKSLLGQDQDLINCQNNGRFVIAGKTGTPLFPHDRITHQQRLERCDRIKSQSHSIGQQHQMARCLVAPYKWFGSLLGERLANGQIHWSKAVVVLAERNWQINGLIDTPQDRGGNVAAELALRMAHSLAKQHQPPQFGERP